MAPFDRPLPPPVRDDLILHQFGQLRANTPALVLAVVLTTIAALLAVLGDLPWWRQFIPPALIMLGCAFLMLGWVQQKRVYDVEKARRIIARAPLIAGAFGLVAGLWCVSAFAETERYYCVVAPVFIALSVMMAANCVSSAPHAALASVIAGFGPIVIKMVLFDNLGIRSIAAMMVVMGAMQLRLIYAKFDETVRTIGLEHELRVLAETDPLTGLDNRRAFDRKFEHALAEGPIAVVAIDLDGFKGINDTYGHSAGDAVLREVGARLHRLFPAARSIARLGGDEFAMLLPPGSVDDAGSAIRAALSLPMTFGGATIAMAASAGMAIAPRDGRTANALHAAADFALYDEKMHARRVAHRLAG